MVRPFRVIESLCVSKGLPETKEDRLVITPDFVAVIDGATSSAPLASGMAGGIVAAEAIAAAVEKFNPNITPQDAVNAMTKAVFNATGDWPDESKNRPCAAVVIYSALRAEVWRVCDCHIRMDETVLDGEIAAGRIPYTYRSAITRALLKLGKTSLEKELARPVNAQPFWPFVEVQNVFLNNPDDAMGFGAINGLPVPKKFIEVHSTQGVKSLVLCSDGFFHPAPTLAEGLVELARLKHEDPLLCYQVNGSRPFPVSSQFFDDTTYVRLELT